MNFKLRQAISNLHKQQSDYPDKFSYIKFPFGIIGYDGLDMQLKYHEYITLKEKVAEEKSWLEQAKQNYGSLGIDIDNISKKMYGLLVTTITLILYGH